ncbi:tetratricopeptide repeat protein [Candidatus Poribacteria bacterium]|nr:tetratricopeptide repeat protein [Candidatus Poribacteria bacterium]
MVVNISVALSLYLIAITSLGWSQEAKIPETIDKIELLQNQLSINPKNVEIRLELAQLYLKIENYRSASIEYQEIINSYNQQQDVATIIQANYGLGLSYAGLEKYEDAIVFYKKAILYNPNRAHIHAAYGAALFQLHRYDDALKVYTIAYGIEPQDIMILHQLGNIYSKLGNTSMAIEFQEKVISLQPSFAEAYYQLGLLYAKENRYNDSIAAYEKAYIEDSELIQSLYNLSQVYLRIGNRDVAIEKMQLFQERKAIIEPLNKLKGALQRSNNRIEKAKIQANIARYYLNIYDYERAVVEYEKAIGFNSKVVEAYNGIGIAYMMLNRFPEAIKSQQKAIALNPEFANAYASIALLYLKQKKYELALNHYRQAISISVKNAENRNLSLEFESYKKIGLILISQKSYLDAISAFQASIQINPDDSEIHYNIGLAYANEEKYQNALSSISKAIEIYKHDQGRNTKDPFKSDIKPGFLSGMYLILGELNEKLYDPDNAKLAYINADTAQSYNALAQLTTKLADKNNQIKNQMLKEALSYANHAIELDSSIASLYNTRAIISFKLGEWEIAEKSIKKAIELEPNNPIYQEGLNQILKK